MSRPIFKKINRKYIFASFLLENRKIIKFKITKNHSFNTPNSQVQFYNHKTFFFLFSASYYPAYNSFLKYHLHVNDVSSILIYKRIVLSFFQWSRNTTSKFVNNFCTIFRKISCLYFTHICMTFFS